MLGDCRQHGTKSQQEISSSPKSRATQREMWEAPSREYTETPREVAMDKPRHPQVIRPWKTQQTRKNKWSAPPTTGSRPERSKKPSIRKHD